MKAENLAKAARYNLYTIDNIPAQIMRDKYFSEHYQYYIEKFSTYRISDSLKQIKGIEVGTFVHVIEQFTNNGEHELYYIEYAYIVCLSEKTDMPLVLLMHKGKYHLHPFWGAVNKYHKLNNSERIERLHSIKEPSNMGVFTEKKIADWVEYCIRYIDVMEQLMHDTQAKEKNNKDYIEKVVSDLPNAKVDRFKNCTTITTSLFRIEFQLLESGSYLSKKVEYKGTIADIIRLQM